MLRCGEMLHSEKWQGRHAARLIVVPLYLVFQSWLATMTEAEEACCVP